MKKHKNSYLNAIKEYQDKIYLPGYYIGGKISPHLKAKTKAGGYFLLGIGVLYFIYAALSFFQLVDHISIETIAPILFFTPLSLLSIIVGIKFIKMNKKH